MRHRTQQPMLNWHTTADATNVSMMDVVPGRDDRTTSGNADVVQAVPDRPRAPATHIDRLSREQVVDEILSRNPSATLSFLEEFSEDRLRSYLTRLRASQLARGRDSRWLRQAESPAIVAHERLL